jgi:hypothetical protein
VQFRWIDNICQRRTAVEAESVQELNASFPMRRVDISAAPDWNARLAALLTAIFMLTSAPARAGSSTGYGYGGRFATYDPIVARYNATGELFRIEGHCQSSCTLFLGIRNVCIDPGANLLFHAGRDRNHNVSASATQHMLAAYKPKLRAFLVANHYTDSSELHAISGRELIERFGYRRCPEK